MLGKLGGTSKYASHEQCEDLLENRISCLANGDSHNRLIIHGNPQYIRENKQLQMLNCSQEP
jgi:hypothetical protein